MLTPLDLLHGSGTPIPSEVMGSQVATSIDSGLASSMQLLLEGGDPGAAEALVLPQGQTLCARLTLLAAAEHAALCGAGGPVLAGWLLRLLEPCCK